MISSSCGSVIALDISWFINDECWFAASLTDLTNTDWAGGKACCCYDGHRDYRYIKCVPANGKLSLKTDNWQPLTLGWVECLKITTGIHKVHLPTGFRRIIIFLLSFGHWHKNMEFLSWNNTGLTLALHSLIVVLFIAHKHNEFRYGCRNGCLPIVPWHCSTTHSCSVFHQHYWWPSLFSWQMI